MKTNIHVHGRPWRLGLAATCAFILLVGLGLSQQASAQNLNSFKILTESTPFNFFVNGHDIIASGDANINNNGTLSSSGPNTLQVGWKPPDVQGTSINFLYTGADDPGAFGNNGLKHNDILKVYIIGGAFLTNAGGFQAGTGLAGSPTGTFFDWPANAASANPWGYANDNGSGDHQVVGYENGNGVFGNAVGDDLAYRNANNPNPGQNDATTGKNVTGAKAYGQFNFGGIVLDSPTTATYLGLDVFGDIIHADGTVGSTGNTGRIRVEGIQATPEGSSLLLLACGIVPLVGVKFLIRRRK